MGRGRGWGNDGTGTLLKSAAPARVKFQRSIEAVRSSRTIFLSSRKHPNRRIFSQVFALVAIGHGDYNPPPKICTEVPLCRPSPSA